MGFAAFAAVLVLAGVLPEDPPAPLPQDPIVARGAGGLVLRRSALEGTLLESFGLFRAAGRVRWCRGPDR